MWSAARTDVTQVLLRGPGSSSSHRFAAAAQVRRRCPGFPPPPTFSAAAQVPRCCRGRRSSPPPSRSHNAAGVLAGPRHRPCFVPSCSWLLRREMSILGRQGSWFPGFFLGTYSYDLVRMQLNVCGAHRRASMECLRPCATSSSPTMPSQSSNA
jgi:hypothetical protein